MKLFYAFVFFAFAPFVSHGQCTVTISHTDNYCYGASVGTAAASSTGTSPFTYLWSPGNQTTASVNGLASGTYTVTMTDALMCTATQTVTITSPPPVSATITSTPPSCGSCCDGSATINFTGGPGPYSYQWIPSGGMLPTASGLCAGTYTCCATDANGCSTCNPGNCSFCQTSVTLSPATGLIEPLSAGNLTVFPVPSTNSITIEQTFAIPVSAELFLTDLFGQVVYSEAIGMTDKLDNEVNISNLPKGFYFVSVRTTAGTSVQRIVKQ
jgi:hypothetical protein